MFTRLNELASNLLYRTYLILIQNSILTNNQFRNPLQIHIGCQVLRVKYEAVPAAHMSFQVAALLSAVCAKRTL